MGGGIYPLMSKLVKYINLIASHTSLWWWFRSLHPPISCLRPPHLLRKADLTTDFRIHENAKDRRMHCIFIRIFDLDFNILQRPIQQLLQKYFNFSKSYLFYVDPSLDPAQLFLLPAKQTWAIYWLIAKQSLSLSARTF